jgi:hypothetical protein
VEEAIEAITGAIMKITITIQDVMMDMMEICAAEAVEIIIMVRDIYA